MQDTNNNPIRHTALYDLHKDAGAKFANFAGHNLPLNYRAGAIKEHLHTRAMSSLFDVSHMAQVSLIGKNVDSEMEQLVPGDLKSLSSGQMRYTMFTNATGGVLDDFIVTRVPGGMFLVLNASQANQDLQYLIGSLSKDIAVELCHDYSLLALQGPKSACVLARYISDIGKLRFMNSASVLISGIRALVTRSGYTGEDGFEISVENRYVEALVRALLREPEIALAGLASRDSLRLEAGLCLYGQDLTPSISPVEANLSWTISRRRLEEGGYPGDSIIRDQRAQGTKRRRIGVCLSTRSVPRAGMSILDSMGNTLGKVTSGGFSPNTQRSIAMGYIDASAAQKKCAISIEVRGRTHAGEIVSMPFIPHQYAK